MEFPKKTIAAIDIGTNSAHMVIAEMDHVGEMRILDSDKATLRLGLALDEAMNLSDDAIRRTVETLRHMSEIIAPYTKTIRAVATHATRAAQNHRRLLQAIKTDAGIAVELIDGIEEARLTFLGMRYGLALSGVDCLAVDVGGGSTEIIIARDDDIAYVASYKLGAVTLADRFFGRQEPTTAALTAMRDHILSRLGPVGQEGGRHPYTRALASSGTAKALAFVHASRQGGAPVNDPNGYALPQADLAAIVAELATLLTPARIKAKTGLDGARAEIILPGAMILEEAGRILGVKEWVITSYGLREGLVADTFYRVYGETASGELPDIQWHSVLQFAHRLRINEAHALHVKRLALRLYRQLAPILRPEDTPEQRDDDLKLVKAAAYLREAGKFLSAPQYHKHSAYLIANSRLPGFTESERALMGLIARFHRKGLPTAEHLECADLAPGDVRRLRFLAAFVRLAAALDRTRQGRVRDVEIRVEDQTVELVVRHGPDGPPAVELHKAELERTALEKSWNKTIRLRAEPEVAT